VGLGVSGIAARTGFIEAMAAGHVQRVWFEEMIDTLRSKWQRELPFEELIRLRDELDEMLQQIRAERQIRPPVVRCPKCGHIGEGAAPHVSVRAMILSVIRFDIDDGNATRAVEKQWKAYQKENRLDLNGKVASHDADRPSPAPSHSH
jgi:hypothetical protein